MHQASGKQPTGKSGCSRVVQLCLRSERTKDIDRRGRKHMAAKVVMDEQHRLSMLISHWVRERDLGLSNVLPKEERDNPQH